MERALSPEEFVIGNGTDCRYEPMEAGSHHYRFAAGASVIVDTGTGADNCL
ncbi:hypothetical protein GCM10028817_27490 [Spirosoma pomorum]